jgi:hypothetical protein
MDYCLDTIKDFDSMAVVIIEHIVEASKDIITVIVNSINMEDIAYATNLVHLDKSPSKKY